VGGTCGTHGGEVFIEFWLEARKQETIRKT
jgi:hypothetical protein